MSVKLSRTWQKSSTDIYLGVSPNSQEGKKRQNRGFGSIWMCPKSQEGKIFGHQFAKCPLFFFLGQWKQEWFYILAKGIQETKPKYMGWGSNDDNDDDDGSC